MLCSRQRARKKAEVAASVLTGRRSAWITDKVHRPSVERKLEMIRLSQIRAIEKRGTSVVPAVTQMACQIVLKMSGVYLSRF